MMVRMDFDETLRKAIGRYKGSRFSLARAAEMSPIELTRYIRGDRQSMTLRQASRLCAVLGLELRPRRRRPKRKGT